MWEMSSHSPWRHYTRIIYWGQSEYTAGSYNQSNLSTLQVEKWLNGITAIIYNLQLIAAFSMYDMVQIICMYYILCHVGTSTYSFDSRTDEVSRSESLVRATCANNDTSLLTMTPHCCHSWFIHLKRWLRTIPFNNYLILNSFKIFIFFGYLIYWPDSELFLTFHYLRWNKQTLSCSIKVVFMIKKVLWVTFLSKKPDNNQINITY